jgi:Mg/Co/Ni transporter MgtE
MSELTETEQREWIQKINVLDEDEIEEQINTLPPEKAKLVGDLLGKVFLTETLGKSRPN